MQFKDALIEVKRATTHLGNAAGQLKNQNLADIIKSAVAKITQAIEHPDVDAVSEEHVDGAHDAFYQEHAEPPGEGLQPGTMNAPRDSAGSRSGVLNENGPFDPNAKPSAFPGAAPAALTDPTKGQTG